ncbi:transcription factor Gibbin [Boleophthalmus pectinirostris]|uniref:transcription factor Gibbin n=1 Tax=Boleophthalmus pectinirostris TaxID=150288 RepID=UPI000A1C224C|nr:transcription factor Gibbin [Boleophthalmus pectinirostris]XP_055013000.1 transcription factor Gibbin [Boleophthalmus pectinirostris]XP_055013001.1 transcription factor Gibbin [Boleophthalmus pectinirostris]XP_055013002.1 transcription factor Gibbin [Boleophthalmus pectinirostris]XP_055013003.1 transcription factor Gibbin [Boleophthalmus pectinirostris]XP_055013004.1 transcription factor Gibbin [Boleophthalmus pectinirostris]XP_055013005.1 transcription factor Gibbin [Boleophthalmus pectin
MSGLSDHLRSGRFVPPLGCGGPRLDERGFVGGLQEPELWSRELGLQDLSNNEVALVNPEHLAPSSPSALSNGLHRQGRLGLGACKQRQVDSAVDHLFTQTLINMQTHMEVSSFIAPEHSRTSSQPLSLTVHPGDLPSPNNRLAAPVPNTETDSSFCPNESTESSSAPVEGEKKYALRSSGRPRFPCHLRKSTRLRRSSDNMDKRIVQEREADGSGVTEEKMWTVKHEETPVVQKEEQPKEESVVPTAPCPTDIPLALTVPKPLLKPEPRLGHRPGPKSRCRPLTKPVHKAAPKSILRQRQAAQALAMARAATHVPFTSPCPAPRISTRVDAEGMPLNGRRRGRYTGVRRIVVKVARIPVSLSRRQKSYKISNLDTLSVTEKTNEGSVEGSDAVREPTALLRMKNNGKSVMVMFPPGEMPVILKRRRGRPPKQPPIGLPGDTLPIPGTPAVDNGNSEPVKKQRRRRRTKLPCPFPSYVNDTNDVKSEYGDVLSKLAFLNRTPPATGRCSPPRCWTPSEPESFHTPMENPGISTLLHRLTGCRRPRGSRGMGRGGGVGRGNGVAGGIGGTEQSKSTFSDFFESIGKKRKLSMSDHGLPRKRGKGGHGRGGGVVGTEPGGEKTVRKRRMRKNGTFKGDTFSMGHDWLNGVEGWGEEGGLDKVRTGYQFCGPSRGGFSSCEYGRGAFSGSGGGRGGGPAGEDQSLFAGYFRSLLDSDDSSDLLDISSVQSDSNKSQCNPSYEGSSSGMNPGFPKWSSKSAGGEGAPQGHSSSARPSYSYISPAQLSPTRSSFPKSTPPSLSHSPSSHSTSTYGHYSSGYSSSSPAGLSQRSPDCSFAYGKNTPAGYSNYPTGPKRGFGGYNSSTGPNSPGGGYMSVAKGGPFNPSSPDNFKQYNSNQWSYRQTYGSWSDGCGSQYHGFNEYGSNESKDILDISNYTPQKAKRLPFPESLSESSSDSSHLSSAACGHPTSGPYRHSEASHLPMSGEGGQSSLSSLEKLMMDWHESATGPSYNWSQNVLFQGGGTSKPGRGRRKRTEMDKEGSSALHSHSPSGSSPTPGPRRGVGRGRGSRGGRGGLSPCQRSGAKGRGKAQLAQTGSSLGGTPGPLEGPALCHEALDYYSGDSSSLSPLATPNPPPPSSYLQDPCEYTSPYSAHPSTPSSEERYPTLFPGESSSSLSPSVSSPPYPPKPTPPPPQTYHPRTFSPSCSPSPRITPHCGTALSPSHRPPPKEPQFSQYDSPSYCSSPYWYGQSHSGSPSPQMHNTHSNTAIHAHSNPHTSPHGASQGNSLNNMHVNPAQLDPQHQSTNMSSHMSSTLSHSLPQNQPNAHLSPHSTPSLHSGLYKERSPPSGMAPHTVSTGHRQGPMPLSPYPKPSLDSSPHQEDISGFSMSQPSYQGMGPRYPTQAPPGGGVLCQLLDQANEDSFSVTSL